MIYPEIKLVVEQLTRVGFLVRDHRLLEAALERPQATFGGEPLYETFELQAAAMVHSIIKNHPLFDGNKRSSWFLLQIFAGLNELKVQASVQDALEFVLAVATDELTLEQSAVWISEHLIVTSLG